MIKHDNKSARTNNPQHKRLNPTKYIIQIQIQIQITLFFPEIVHNNYMGIYKMNHRIT